MSATYDLVAYFNALPYVRRFGADDRWMRDIAHIGTTVYGVSFNRNTGRYAVAHGTSPGLSIYDTSTADWVRLSGTPTVPNAAACAFSPDGSLLAVTTTGSPFLYVFDAATWAQVSVQPAGDRAYGVAFSPDGSMLALAVQANVSGGALQIYDTSTWALLTGVPNMPTCYRLAFSADGSMLAVTAQNSPYIRVIDTTTWSLLPVPAPSGVCYGVSFSPDGSMLALAQQSDPGLVVYDVSSWSQLAGLPSQGGAAYSITFSPDSRMLAIGLNAAPYMRVYDTTTWAEEAFNGLNLIQSNVQTVAFSDPDLGEIVGTVRDVDGNPAERKIRAYRRADGRLVAETQSDALSGDYALSIVDGMDYDIQAMTADGERLNDLFYARVTPG